MLIDPNAFNYITQPTLAAAIEVHRTLGAGLLESIYMPCLQYELSIRQLSFIAQKPIPVVYKGMALETVYRVDLIVEGKVVVEVKAAGALLPIHQSQTLTYMRLAGCPVGLLINFNAPKLIDGVKRLIRPVIV